MIDYIVGMEGTQVASKSSKKRKDPASTTRGHRVWKKVEEDMLIKTMRDVFKIKWKQDNGQFQPGFYAEVEKHIILAFPGTDLRSNPHIASKIKQWRKQYNMLVDILRQSGFAWDDTLKMVKIDSEQVWEEYVSSHGEAKGMLNKPFPYYEDWLFLFGKDRATGEFAEGPVDAMAAIDLEEGESVEKESAIDCDSVSMNGSPSNPDDNGKGKKKSRSAEGMAALVSMAEAMSAHLKETNGTMAEIAHRIGYDQDLSNARQRVYAELLPLGFDTHTRMKAAAMIAKDAVQLDLFSGTPEEDKAEWVMLLLGGFFKEDK